MARDRILIAEPQDFSLRALERLRQVADVTLQACSRADLIEAFEQFDVIWVRLAQRVDAGILRARGRCRIVACPATGLDHIDIELCDRLGIRVVSLKGEREFLRNVRATAELTLALALALLRRIPEAAESVLSGSWNRDAFRGHELYEKCAGIVGVGRLGSIAAQYFGALGMRVVGYDPTPTGSEHVESTGSLGELLVQADVVSLHVNYSASTHHMIGARELALMKPSGVLINTARGALIDQQALIAALDADQLAGAALDVLEGEPDIDIRHPVVQYARQHRNLLVVPHIGGSTSESLEKAELFVTEKVIAALLATGPSRARV